MKKITGLILVCALFVSSLTACGSNYQVTESTVFIEKDGKVVSVDVEDFDASKYSEEGLKTYVQDAVDAFNKENGNGSVKLDSLAIADDKAVLTISYGSVEEYVGFNGIELFSGSVAESLAAGYTFDTEFASVKEGIAPAKSGDFVNDSDYKVAVIRANVDVVVKGNVYFTSVANVASVDKNCVSIVDGANILGVKEETSTEVQEATDTEGTEMQEEELATDVMEEDASVDEGSIDEDDLVEDEAEEEIVFDFGPEEEVASENTDSFSNVYTYIIYK